MPSMLGLAALTSIMVSMGRGAGIVGVAASFVGSWKPSARAVAAGAPIKIDVGRLQEGDMLGPIPAWCSRPIFVVKRTRKMLDEMNEPKYLKKLPDPDSKEPQ